MKEKRKNVRKNVLQKSLEILNRIELLEVTRSGKGDFYVMIYNTANTSR